MITALWVNQERHFFIGNVEGVTPMKTTYIYLWRQLNETSNADAEQLAINVPQSKIVKL